MIVLYILLNIYFPYHNVVIPIYTKTNDSTPLTPKPKQVHIHGIFKNYPRFHNIQIGKSYGS
jgi:hypothetical protein